MERIQKIIARSLSISRRKCEDLIREGRVTLAGRVIRLGESADPGQGHLCVDGKALKAPPPPAYFLLNKPRGVMCTARDPQGRLTVVDLVKSRIKVFPVGRLDMDSTGLVILTNDGDLTYRISRAGEHCPKVYHVKVAGNPSEDKLDRLRAGIAVAAVRYAPCKIEKMKEKPHSYTWLKMTLCEGKNREIRRMMEAVHHPVFQLKRVAIGPLTDRDLPLGYFRPLTEREVQILLKLPMEKVQKRRPGKK